MAKCKADFRTRDRSRAHLRFVHRALYFRWAWWFKFSVCTCFLQMSHVCVHAVFQQRRREALSLGSWWFIVAICKHMWIPVISKFSPEFNHCLQEFISFFFLPAQLERFIWQITEKCFYIYEQKTRKSQIQPLKDVKSGFKVKNKHTNKSKVYQSNELTRGKACEIMLSWCLPSSDWLTMWHELF